MQPSFTDRIMTNVATLGCIGHLPKAPGTWGSLAAALVAPLAFLPLSLPLRLLLLVMIFALGVLVCTRAETVLHAKDPGCVIWDELFGQWIALLPLGTHAPWWLLVAGFLLFRVFDIFKPWPVRQLEQKYDGGLGIMLDDGAAGIYALLGVWLLQRLA